MVWVGGGVVNDNSIFPNALTDGFSLTENAPRWQARNES